MMLRKMLEKAAKYRFRIYKGRRSTKLRANVFLYCTKDNFFVCFKAYLFLPSFKDVCLCCLSFTFQILLSFVWFFLLLIFLVIIIVRSLLLDLWVKSAVALFAFPTLASDFQQTEKEKARGLSTLYYLSTINGSFQSEKKNLKFCHFRHNIRIK